MTAYGTIIGHLGSDPKRVTVGQYPAVKASIASTFGYGERKKTTWWNVTAFGKIGEALARCAKGSHLAISGELYEDSWTGQDGITRKNCNCSASAVTFLARKPGETDSLNEAHDGVGLSSPDVKTGYSSIPTDSDVPF